MADLGSALGGAASGASLGTSVFPGIGTAIGGIGGLIAGLFGGGGPKPQELAANAGGPNTQILGSAFKSTMSPEQQQQIIAQRVLAAYPKLGTLENALQWYAVRKKLADEGGKGLSKNDAAVLSVVDSALSEQGININMANPDQLKAIFGEQGAAFLSTPTQDLITMNQQALQTARDTAAQAPQILQAFKAEAGLDLTPEQQAQQEQRRNLLVSSILDPARQQLASAGATAERAAAARGTAASPLLERDILRQQGQIGAEAGKTASLQMEDARQKALAQLPDVISKSIAAGLTPEQYVNQIEQQRTQVGAQQSQLAAGGFQTATNAAAQERSLGAQTQAERDKVAQVQADARTKQQAATSAGLAGLGASVATALGGKKPETPEATDKQVNDFFDQYNQNADVEAAINNPNFGNSVTPKVRNVTTGKVGGAQ